MENEVEWDQQRWGRNGAVPMLDCLWACGRVSKRAERWRGRGGRVRQWVRELRQLGTAVRARVAVRGRAVGRAVRLGVSEIVSWREERRRCELNAEMKWGIGNVRVYNYVYIWGYFSNYIYNRVLGCLIKSKLDPDSLRGFLKKKIHTRPYSLSGRVGYSRVGFKLPSLPMTPL